MTLNEIMNAIEQYRFSSELNLAAGARAFRRGLRSHTLFQLLTEQAKNPAVRQAIASRVQALAAMPIDARYENRYDTALSAYLTVLYDTAEPETVTKAASAAACAGNTWWAAGISRELIARAVATGHSQKPAVPAVAPSSLVGGDERHNALRLSLRRICRVEIPFTAKTVAGNQILEALREADVKAQAQAAANKVIAMSPPSEDGERLVWKARSRRGAPGRALHSRAKQLARA